MMKDTFKTFPYKFENCEKLPVEPIPNQCWVCPQFDCCKWKRRIEKELREDLPLLYTEQFERVIAKEIIKVILEET